LPNQNSADWWIKHRNATLDELLAESTNTSGQIYTPFTSQYPRYGRLDALDALGQLGEDFIVLDLETTGLQAKEHEIVEIAIVHYGTREVILSTLVRPFNIAAYEKSKARELHNISMSDVLEAPTFLDLSTRIADIISNYHCCIFNAAFDAPFLAYQYLKYGQPVPKITATCVMRLFTAFMNVSTNLSLETACKIMSVNQESNGKAHSALADVLSTCDLLQAMRQRVELH
jgi:DNA polymerase-3 subunit epsilon